jgi:hypothetical protein
MALMILIVSAASEVAVSIFTSCGQYASRSRQKPILNETGKVGERGQVVDRKSVPGGSALVLCPQRRKRALEGWGPALADVSKPNYRKPAKKRKSGLVPGFMREVAGSKYLSNCSVSFFMVGSSPNLTAVVNARDERNLHGS